MERVFLRSLLTYVLRPWVQDPVLCGCEAALAIKSALKADGHRCAIGEAVQVQPMKSKLKAPGTKLLKLKYDNLLSNFAFNFNLRRYNKNADGEYECPVLNKTFTVEPGRRCSRHVMSCN